MEIYPYALSIEIVKYISHRLLYFANANHVNMANKANDGLIMGTNFA